MSDVAIFSCSILVLPILVAALNLCLLRRLFREKRGTAESMLELALELRAATQRSNRKFSQVMEAIEDLHTGMDDNQEVVERRLSRTLNMFGGESNGTAEWLAADFWQSGGLRFGVINHL